jgi:glucose/arabinose dehydrogenase
MNGHEVLLIERLVDGLGRIRDIRQGPDGLIYIAIDDADSKIVRLEPADD